MSNNIVCGMCGESKVTELYPKGAKSRCKTCIAIYKKEYFQKNKEKISAERKAAAAARTPEQIAQDAERRGKSYQKNKAKISARQKRYSEENKEAIVARGKRYRLKNAEKIREQKALDYQKNKKAKKEKVRAWQAANPGKVQGYKALNRAKRKKRYPRWMTDSLRDQTLDFYILSRALSKWTGVKYHVDHIMPLCGEDVSGLHVPGNLQVVTATQNLEKNNSFII